MPGRRPIILALVAAGMALLVCLNLRSDRTTPPIRNVLLISIDTCRADHVGCHGDRKPTTPQIDRLADESLVFTHAIAPAPLTLPSHATMLTGLSPLGHGIHDNLDYYLTPDHTTLAEVLRGHGFATGAVVSAFVLDRQFGLDQGFDRYIDQLDDTPADQDFEVNERKAGATTRLALDWLEQHADERFFLFLHYFDPHVEYAPPEPFATRFAGTPYAGEIAYVDDCIGEVIRRLETLDIADTTLVVVTSDHGEMLGDHGENNHGYFIYDSTIHVPLVIRLPTGRHRRTVNGAVGLLDIVPTVCGLLDIDPPDAVEGRDLLAEAEPAAEPPAYYCESYTPTKYGAAPLVGIVRDNWKYIRTTRPELYELTEDRGETVNVFTTAPEMAQDLQAALATLLADAADHRRADASTQVDARTRARLESLGYVGSKVQESADTDPARDDPKDLLAFYLANLELMTLIRTKRYQQARQVADKLLAKRPDAWRTRIHAAHAALALNDPRAALMHLAETLRLKPALFEAHDKIGALHLAQGDRAQAVEHLTKALQLMPGNMKTRSNLATALAMQARFDDAIAHFLIVLEADPDVLNARNGIAQALSQRGDMNKAIEHFERSLETQPGQIAVHNRLAEIHRDRHHPELSIHHWNASLRLLPQQPEVLTALASVHAGQGKITKALDYWQQTLRLKPDQPVVLNNLAWIQAVSSNRQLRAPEQAVELAERARELTRGEDAETLDTLAAAYASARRFSEARKLAAEAAVLAVRQGRPQLADAIRARLELYRQDRAYSE